MDETTYKVAIGTRTRGISYAVTGWESLTLQEVGSVLSTVTGYTREAVIETVERNMDRLGYSHVVPADCGGEHSPLRFLIRRDKG